MKLKGGAELAHTIEVKGVHYVWKICYYSYCAFAMIFAGKKNALNLIKCGKYFFFSDRTKKIGQAMTTKVKS